MVFDTNGYDTRGINNNNGYLLILFLVDFFVKSSNTQRPSNIIFVDHIADIGPGMLIIGARKWKYAIDLDNSRLKGKTDTWNVWWHLIYTLINTMQGMDSFAMIYFI